MSFSLVNFEQKIMVFPSRSVSADVPYLAGFQNDTSEILNFVYRFLQSSESLFLLVYSFFYYNEIFLKQDKMFGKYFWDFFWENI